MVEKLTIGPKKLRYPAAICRQRVATRFDLCQSEADSLLAILDYEFRR